MFLFNYHVFCPDENQRKEPINITIKVIITSYRTYVRVLYNVYRVRKSFFNKYSAQMTLTTTFIHLLWAHNGHLLENFVTFDAG